MPEILNLNNSYNISNSKKISSKLTFNTGEKFSGKVIKKGEGNTATIKLVDGWEFEAEIDGDIDSLDQGFNKFQVEDFKDGKIKLKLIKQDTSSESGKDSELSNILSKEGLEKADETLLKEMLKFDIPLTKDNIRKIKSFINFKENMVDNPKEIDVFIEKYLQSKGIEQNSSKGEAITKELKEFLDVFKNMSKEDILLFLENDIDFTTENINGYTKLFKEGESLESILKNLEKELDNFDVKVSEKGIEDTVNTKENIPKGEALDSKLDSLKAKITEKGIENKSDTKVNIPRAENINNEEKDSVDKVSSNIAKGIYEKQDSKANSKINILGILKSMSGKSEEPAIVGLKEILNNRKNEFTTNEFKEISSKLDKLSTEDVLLEFKEITNNSKGNDFLKALQKSMESDNNKSTKDLNITKNEFTKEALDKTISSFLGKEIKLTEEEFLKLNDIIKLEGKNIEEANINNKDINTKVEVKDELSNKDIVGQAKEEILVKEAVKEIIKDKPISQEVIKDSIVTKSEEGKNIIKEVLSQVKGDNENSTKIINILKNSINDIKLFNKISQEYYYMDIPVNIRERDYPCKLIVKDNRKDGKKIDSTNVKLVVTVKTINLGTVDGYIKVLDKKISVDLKCEEKALKVVDMAKEKLIKNIQSLGFTVGVKVSKKEDEVSITSCREFFNDNNTASIDIKV
ncbi:hypothetical protein [Clostridium chauvoei]|uniref:Flagellar hook-length control protein FliK n=1 Tax=Clostridium chauvoei TaxID=46867 RepID=A0ABD4RET2_9CLOT|nr:hypothetical protein [Clostridium chauvoei]ATD54406.1 hypothetical protein BTM20_03810 [Clostridium chauvoei]ATD57911.1 hypothetical protein BTM21_09250 [Clostridium chauvoei]MBX7279702.1 hypothetical protein [Clostridium chauvoei]MBX7282071.1 hypothetical protein [Clostridium chauvoei]MBX7284593.1 hypothetical protein [Clostridium chauvoei]